MDEYSWEQKKTYWEPDNDGFQTKKVYILLGNFKYMVSSFYVMISILMHAKETYQNLEPPDFHFVSARVCQSHIPGITSLQKNNK